MYQISKKPQNAIQVLKAGVLFWFAHWKELLTVTAVALILGALPPFFFPELNSLDKAFTVAYIEQHMIFVAIFALAMFLIFAFIVAKVDSIMKQGKESNWQSARRALRAMPSLVVGLLIYDVVIVLGFFVLVIPGIAFSIYLAFYFSLMITDNLGPITAFKASWNLVTDNWFHSFFVLIVMLLVIGVLSEIIKVYSIDLWVVVHPTGDGILRLGNQILQMISGMFFYGFFVSILLMLQHDLKLRKQESLSEA